MLNDLGVIIKWWGYLFFVGLVCFPLLYHFFKKHFDLGYGLTKTLSTLVLTYLMFLMSTVGVLPFERTSMVLIIALLTGINFVIFKKYKKNLIKDVKKKGKVLAFQEFLFLWGLLLWSYVRAHQPDIRGLEKFMDFGFINSILKTKYLPATDMWFAGEHINYYWFGHFWVAVLTKLSNISSSITYNLSLGTILGIALTSTFSLVTTLINDVSKNKAKIIVIGGLISSFVLVFGGNFHTPYFVLKNGSEKYWYPDATRFIGYNPDTNDKTIHEFPLYSFVVSDLHAHLINLSFVLLFLSWLYLYVGNLDYKKHKINLDEIFKIIPLGFLLGIFFMTNAWDFANYSLVAGVGLSTFYLMRSKINSELILSGLVRIFAVGLCAIFVIYPFLSNFESLAEGVKLVTTHTPPWQLMILWGFPAIVTGIFFYLLYKNTKKIKLPDKFVLSLAISSWILIVLPEIFYVKDIYVSTHYRANTMFKLTYQAFVMFSLLSGYVVVRVFDWVKDESSRFLLKTVFVVSLCSVLSYPYFAIKGYYGSLDTYKGLDGVAWLKTNIPERYALYTWLSDNVVGQTTILEAPGDSYTDYNVVSSYTGFPTVSGWFVHEWLWRGDSSFPQDRVGNISQIYTSTNTEHVRSLLSKYGVEYVIVGNQEKQKFPTLTRDVFEQIGSVVYKFGGSYIYAI